MTPAQDPEKLAVSIPEAAAMCSISRTLAFEMISSGAFGPHILKIGRKSIIRVSELRDWVDSGMPSRDHWIWPKKGAKTNGNP